MDIQRQDFESCFKATEIYKRELQIRQKDILEFSSDFGYFNIVTNDAWLLWKASSSIPEGFVLVPKEPTKKMIDAGVDNTPETPSQDYWHSSQPLDDEQAEACYKAMIEAVEKN